MSTRISIKQIVKVFKAPGGGRTAAIDGVSVDVEPGELFFLLGPSGCGKTTLLRSIAGFVDPDSGSIVFERDGHARDVTHTPANQRKTAMVFQSYALWPHMTVADNVAFGLKVLKLQADERKTRVKQALRDVQMESYADRKPTQLSGGQQQRVALARALVVRPDVLLLDEPLSNLDAKLRNELRTEIRRIVKESGLTAVYVTHDQKEALSMADRVAVMLDGKIEQVGTPADLYHRPTTTFVGSFLGETNQLDAATTSHEGSSYVRVASTDVPLGIQIEAKNVWCLIRPESMTLSALDERGVIPSTVEEAVFLGEHVQYRVATDDGTQLVVSTTQTVSPHAPGDRVGVRVDPDRLVLLPR
ncbi:MAG: ABC transporter ATP-binding protein [Planctomycetota bacterium]